jgi:hypothetical protein
LVDQATCTYHKDRNIQLVTTVAVQDSALAARAAQVTALLANQAVWRTTADSTYQQLETTVVAYAALKNKHARLQKFTPLYVGGGFVVGIGLTLGLLTLLQR